MTKVGLEVKFGPILEELKIESLELWKIRLAFIKLKKLACIKTKGFFKVWKNLEKRTRGSFQKLYLDNNDTHREDGGLLLMHRTWNVL